MDEKNTAKTVSLGEIFASLKAHFVFIIAFTLALSVIGAVYALAFKKTTYTASATLQVYVAPTGNISETTAYSFGTYLAEGYMKVLKYPEYVKKAADNDIKINPNALKFTHPDKSVILEVTYSIKSKQNVKEKTANDLTEYLKFAIEEINKSENSYYANRLRIESEATADTVSANRGTGTTIMIFFLLGLVASVAIIVIKYFVDDTFKSKEEVEEITGATVLTVVALLEGDGRKSKCGAKGGTENV